MRLHHPPIAAVLAFAWTAACAPAAFADLEVVLISPELAGEAAVPAEAFSHAVDTEAGKPVPGRFVVNRRVDAHSTVLFSLAATGDVVEGVSIEVRIPRAGAPRTLARFALRNVRVVSIQVAVPGGGEPFEQVTFSYEKLEVLQDQGGKLVQIALFDFTK